MSKIKHKIQIINDPSAGPPEYIIRGATSVPVIRPSRPVYRKELNINNRRKFLRLFEISSCTLDDFYSLLFSNENFFIENYDESHVLNLIELAVLKSGHDNLFVHLNFQIESDGTFLLVQKFFYTNDYYPYKFDNELSSTIRVEFSQEPSLEYADVRDGSTNLVAYKETVYRFHERLYVDVLINHPQENHILPLVIAYDDFGIVYVDFFYQNKLVDKSILISVKPSFNDKVVDFNYFTKDEVDTVKMFLI